MLEIEGLAVEREERLLFSGLSVKLSAGEGLHIIGKNGAGKTTLLRVLCGLTSPVVGKIKWCDQDVSEFREAFCSELLYLGHKNANKTELNCRENLKLALGVQSVSEQEVGDALHEAGLGMLSHLPTRFLSQGQQRRLSLARLLLTKAKLWILDEPYVALDYKAIEWLDSILERHLKNQGLLVLTSHQALTMSSTIRVLNLGEQHA
ncbi:ABC transporter involved in cytochrome c biogenesis, ATPase component CcmA [hydrothermal vent metagenome]|uniref:ABC transporter involved in cytochrome c biogenesis, ATPase component CcmA n=1 Tax=hydrothermal vent metagenome TaxID=652676 RepID=A0A3B0WNT4_9ZZZZ